MSLHNVTLNNQSNMQTYPSDLQNARNNAELVQKGFYAKEALKLEKGYPTKDPGAILRPLDPRLADNDHMLGWPNEAAGVNKDLMAEIE